MCWARVIQPELAIATGGEWDSVKRRLRLTPSRDPVWAFNYTSSKKARNGLFWLPSGAGHFNQFAYEAVRADIYFNEVRAESLPLSLVILSPFFLAPFLEHQF
jgi:hypothetical protein